MCSSDLELSARVRALLRRVDRAAGTRDLPAVRIGPVEFDPATRRVTRSGAPVHLTPATTDRALAADWFRRFEGAGLDGVVAKRLDAAYQPGRRAMVKVKHERTADCVVAGFRWHKNGPGTHVGSLLLGLYDAAGTLHHVGVTSSFSWDERARLLGELAPLRSGALEIGRAHV